MDGATMHSDSSNADIKADMDSLELHDKGSPDMKGDMHAAHTEKQGGRRRRHRSAVRFFEYVYTLVWTFV